ncbi:MAG: tetraacyldisaccharide 4'-kinase [Planctomycetes bacterium]|nr:tetraacyldisaccharide 4'-kinase [Planctomycetota bacterium]
MHHESAYRRIIAGEAGLWAVPVRAGLRILEGAYRCGVGTRNRYYDREDRCVTLPIPVISVGNITVGGTGKTPLVIELASRLERMGHNPTVISRGYGAADGEPNDEERVIHRYCPGLVCLADADRVRAANRAYHEFGADVVLLDDGFQHRRLARDLDLVVIDATCPFGYGHLLPRGLLREPVQALSRAHAVVVTRCDQVSRAVLSRLAARLRELARGAVHLQCTHRVTDLRQLDGTPLDGPLAGRRAVLFAGIGRPESFKTTVRSLSVDVVGERWWPDHHRYRAADISSLLKPGRFPPYDVLITTEKDAVKLTGMANLVNAPIVVVRIAIDFTDDGGTILQQLLEKVVAKSASE